jgi:hypothetical protein
VTATAAVEAEPAPARLHVARLVHARPRKIFFEARDHLRRIAKILVLQSRAGQDRIANEKQILVADRVVLKEILAVGNTAANMEIIRVRRDMQTTAKNARRNTTTRVRTLP